MTGYSVRRDRDRKMIICTVNASYEEQHSLTLLPELADAIAWARASASLNVLFDNRAGRPLAPATSEAIRKIMFEDASPTDRVAILVPSSVTKGLARPQTNAHCGLFLSESAALMWLIGEHPARPGVYQDAI
ncbi:hypothetical protein [Sphingomonas immobilis]|uniref:hypothetical protein n=1 Tax=Sphingomonas immobilis TaxID=3063997 RepID=UPI002729A6BA|nr:hypothetical protein [Sphingomonas sp. CA1-15]